MISKTQQVFLKILKGDLPSHLEGVDLDELFSLFHRHRLFSLAPAIRELLDEDRWHNWKQAIQSRTLKSLHLTSILGDLLRILKSKGIVAIPLKGPVLEQSLYNGTGHRHFRDLDLYIKREDVDEALNILKSLDYDLLSPAKELSKEQWNYYFRYKYDVGLIHREQGVVVELHSGVYYPGLFRVSREGNLWKEQEEVSMGTNIVNTMNKENTFLYLTLHGGHHLYFRLFWLRDVAEALRRWDLDHRNLIILAKELKVERLLFVSLMLVKAFFGVEIPEIYNNVTKKEKKRLDKLVQICFRAILGPEIPDFKRKIERFNFFLHLQSGAIYKWAVLENVINRWLIRNVLDR